MFARSFFLFSLLSVNSNNIERHFCFERASVCEQQQQRNRILAEISLSAMSYQPRVFYVKLQLHFGGDIHEIAVPAYDGAEPTVDDLMNTIERDFRVPRALQNLIFHGQELHPHSSMPLSHFGIKNLGAIRLVGRMAPPDLIQQINAQHSSNVYRQSAYVIPPLAQTTLWTTEQVCYDQNRSVATQYDPPPSTPDKSQEEEKPPATPNTPQPK